MLKMLKLRQRVFYLFTPRIQKELMNFMSIYFKQMKIIIHPSFKEIRWLKITKALKFINEDYISLLLQF